jgi:hypothetical protein
MNKKEQKEFFVRVNERIGPLIGVQYVYYEGVFSLRKQAIRNRIEEIILKYVLFKVGKSCDPNTRFDDEYEPKGFIKMYVVYKSDSPDEVTLAEKEMINIFKGDEKCLNLNDGGGGPDGEEDPYYLYIAVADEISKDIFTVYKQKLKNEMDELKKLNEFKELVKI